MYSCTCTDSRCFCWLLELLFVCSLFFSSSWLLLLLLVFVTVLSEVPGIFTFLWFLLHEWFMRYVCWQWSFHSEKQSGSQGFQWWCLDLVQHPSPQKANLPFCRWYMVIRFACWSYVRRSILTIPLYLVVTTLLVTSTEGGLWILLDLPLLLDQQEWSTHWSILEGLFGYGNLRITSESVT